MKLCNYAYFCQKGNDCQNALTVKKMIELARDGKELRRKDRFEEKPDCHISKKSYNCQYKGKI